MAPGRRNPSVSDMECMYRRRPKFDFVYDGLTPQGNQLLTAMSDATADERESRNTVLSDTDNPSATGAHQPSNSDDRQQPVAATQLESGDTGRVVGAAPGWQKELSKRHSSAVPDAHSMASSSLDDGKRRRRIRPS